MPKYMVIGDIVSGAFTHWIEADTPEQAEELTRALPVTELATVSSERAFGRVDSVELADEADVPFIVDGEGRVKP